MAKDLKKEKKAFLEALKKAKRHREEALERAEKEWKREGVEGKVVLI